MPPYIGEIRLFAGNFAPVGWLPCDGRLISISENDALFTLIGTTYGGDGQETFAIPDLRGRAPMHQGLGPSGTTHIIGEAAGVEEVTLTIQQIPVHTHAVLASGNPGSSSSPGNQVFARNTGADCYSGDSPFVNMHAAMIGPVGGSQPHENMQPFLGLNFIISLYGIFPQFS